MHDAPIGSATLAAPGGPLVRSPQPNRTSPPARPRSMRSSRSISPATCPTTSWRKLDRATMAASLEGRAPFLDHHLVEFACRLPVALKLRGLATKRVLRHAVADLVPAPIRRRVKRGLTVPLAHWLAGPLLPFARDTLARLDPAVIRPAAVRALLDEHLERRRDNRRELWALVMLQLWQDQR